MNDLKSFHWHVRHEDEIWTDEPESRFVATVENPNYPENSKVAEYIVEMHNDQLNRAESSVFDYEKMLEEIRSN